MKQTVIKLLKKYIPLKEKEIEKILEIPPHPEMGDYSFPCFILSKKLKKNPNEVALEIEHKIKKFPTDIQDIQVLGEYINFFINREKFAENLIREILENKNWGRVNLGFGRKALIEHTSINPNASPHVGRVRNAIIGDSIVKILKFMNFKPEVHYYVNDVSKQIAMLVLANAERLKFEKMLKEYISISKKVENSPKLEKKVFELLYRFEQGDKKIVDKFNKVANTCVKGQEKILAELGIHYDFFDYESNYMKDTKEILRKLEKTKKLVKDKDGRMLIDQRGTGVERKMKAPVFVLTRSDGTGLYPLRDIAYTIDKLKKSKKNIIVLGEDQKLYFEQLKEVLKLMKIKAPEIVHYSFILLREKNKSKKMSTRKGDVILLEDFFREAIDKAKKGVSKRKTKGDAKKIAISAVKYSILKNNPNKSILFDLDEALNFEGDTGPYLLYSYARASSILKKAKPKNKKLKISNLTLEETKLVKKLSEFPEIVLNSYNNLNPSLIANYSYQLAQIFNEFYHACPVIGNEKEFFRLKLVDTFRKVLKNSLELLGIEAIEEM